MESRNHRIAGFAFIFVILLVIVFLAINLFPLITQKIADLKPIPIEMKDTSSNTYDECKVNKYSYTTPLFCYELYSSKYEPSSFEACKSKGGALNCPITESAAFDCSSPERICRLMLYNDKIIVPHDYQQCIAINKPIENELGISTCSFGISNNPKNKVQVALYDQCLKNGGEEQKNVGMSEEMKAVTYISCDISTFLHDPTKKKSTAKKCLELHNLSKLKKEICAWANSN